MPRPLPSLNALRAFEAAARLHSFAKAADELGLTPSAVSHKIRALEEYYGAILFRRERGGVTASPAAATLLEPLRAALRLISDAGERIAPPPRRLVVAAPPDFAGRWLLPRLGSFLDAHPDIDFQLHTTETPIAAETNHVQFGICYGHGHWPGLASEKLLDETLVPVAAPRYLEPLELRGLSDLPRAKLLIDLDQPWTKWLECAGPGNDRLRFGEAFADCALALQAAEAGRGIAVGRSVLVADALADGRLAALGDMRMQAGRAYYLTWPRRRSLPPLPRRFRRWLLDVAKRFDAAPGA
jgi:LysR family glycine cleavage system transcriptional activator